MGINLAEDFSDLPSTIKKLESGELKINNVLMVSVMLGIDHIAKYAIENGAKANSDYLNELEKSIECGRANIFKMLHKHRTDIQYDNDRFLFESARYGVLEIVQYLVEQGIDPRFDSDRALKISAQSGHLEVVKYLVGLGADVQAEDNYCIRWSAAYGHLEVIQYLVENGADIHADNDSSLIGSANNYHLDVSKYLISKGLKFDSKFIRQNKDSESVIYYLANKKLNRSKTS